MIKAIKKKMLTYLFMDWVKNETDLDTLKVSKQFIRKILGYLKYFSYIYYVND